VIQKKKIDRKFKELRETEAKIKQDIVLLADLLELMQNKGVMPNETDMKSLNEFRDQHIELLKRRYKHSGEIISLVTTLINVLTELGYKTPTKYVPLV